MNGLVGVLTIAKVQATNSEATILQVDSRSNLPNRGKSDAVYIVQDENASYRWDEDTSKYFCVGRDYTEIEVISGGNANG